MFLILVCVSAEIASQQAWESFLGFDQDPFRVCADVVAFVCREFRDKYSLFRQVTSVFAALDCLYSLAEVAALPNYVRPSLINEQKIHIVGGRHPMSEALISEPFVPNDLSLSRDGARSLTYTHSLAMSFVSNCQVIFGSVFCLGLFVCR